MGKAHTYYRFLEDTAIQRERFSILNGIMALITAKSLIAMLKDSVSVTAPVFAAFSLTQWVNIAMAHECWNFKEPQYNIAARRNYGLPRPDGYRSGPSYWIIPGL